MDEPTELRNDEPEELQPWVVVDFTYEPPDGATTVALAGDFNDWSPDAELMERKEDGPSRWLGRCRPASASPIGSVDRERWDTDPNAELFDDDGLGGQNAVVRTPGTAS